MSERRPLPNWYIKQWGEGTAVTNKSAQIRAESKISGFLEKITAPLARATAGQSSAVAIADRAVQNLKRQAEDKLRRISAEEKEAERVRILEQLKQDSIDLLEQYGKRQRMFPLRAVAHTALNIMAAGRFPMYNEELPIGDYIATFGLVKDNQGHVLKAGVWTASLLPVRKAGRIHVEVAGLEERLVLEKGNSHIRPYNREASGNEFGVRGVTLEEARSWKFLTDNLRTDVQQRGSSLPFEVNQKIKLSIL